MPSAGAKATDTEDTREFYEPGKRSSANAIEIRLRDGSGPLQAEVEYPLGHPRRRAEGLAMVEAKFRKHLARRFPQQRQSAILDVCMDQARFEATPVNEFVGRFAI